MLIALWLFTTSMAAMIVKIMLTLLWLIIMVWAWPLTARFENSVMATLRNALLFGGTSPFTTLAALIIPAIAIGLTVASLQWLPKGLYLLLILGFGIVVQLQIPLFEHALKPYVVCGGGIVVTMQSKTQLFNCTSGGFLYAYPKRSHRRAGIGAV